MCTEKGIDALLTQLQQCPDTSQMRQLLEEANACRRCPEAPETDGEQEPICLCRKRFKEKLTAMRISLDGKFQHNQ